MNRVLLLMCGLSAQAHAQCGGWIHDKYTYGPNFEPGGHGRGVIWDIDGSNGARLPRLVLPARYNYGPFSSSAVDVVMRTSSGWNFMGARVAFEPDSVRLLTIATLAGGQREVFIAGTRREVSTGVKTCEVLRWSGTTWVSYGTGVSGELVDAIGWDPDGDGPVKPRVVIIARQAGGAAATVHQLIGAAWHRVGTIEGDLRVLHGWDPDGNGPLAEVLVCAGSFTVDGPDGAREEGVAVWSGAAWEAMGVRGPVNAMTTWGSGGSGGLLVVGGDFTLTEDGPVSRLAAWDGAAWSGVSSGSSERITALGTIPREAGDGEDLVVGGAFSMIGGVSAPRCAIWDGAAWRGTGSGPPVVPAWLLSHDPDGPLSGAPEILTGSWKWSGREWHSVNDMTLAGVATAGAWNDPRDPSRSVITMLHADDSGTGRTGISTWDGVSLQEHHGTALAEIGEGAKRMMRWRDASDLDGREALVVAGWFDVLDDEGRRTIGIGTWDGDVFRGFPDAIADGGPLDRVTLLTTFDPDGNGPGSPELIAAGSFARSGAEPIYNIAKWDGSLWRPLGGQLHGLVFGLVSWDADEDGPGEPLLLASGQIEPAPGQGATRFALWDGASWAYGVMSVPFVGTETLTVWDSDGVGPRAIAPVAGFFYESGTVPGCEWWEICQEFVTITAHIWEGARWESAWGFGTSWWWDEPERSGWADVLTTWDSDGDGPEPPSLLVGGRFETDVNATIYRKKAGEFGVRELWGGRLEGEQYWTHARVIEVVDLDNSGPIPPLLVVGGRFERLVDTIRARTFPTGGMARYMEGPPGVLVGPRLSGASNSDAIGIEVGAIGPGFMQYAWYRDGAVLAPGTTAGGSTIHDTTRSVLIISNPSESDWGEYHCVVTNACGSTVSRVFVLGPRCAADYGGDTVVDILDFLDFIEDFAACQARPFPCGVLGDADINGDTLVDILDFLDFMDAFASGC